MTFPHIYRGDQYRPVYRCIGELQSHFNDVPYLMLTGTYTEALKETIFKQLYLSSTSVSVIVLPIDRYVYYLHTAEDMMKIT